MNNKERAISKIGASKCIALTTFKRDGSRISTPIWFNVIEGKIYATTEPGAAVNVDEDESAQYWSGYVPVVTSLGEPVTNEDAGDVVPASVRNLVGQNIHEISRLGS